MIANREKWTFSKFLLCFETRSGSSIIFANLIYRICSTRHDNAFLHDLWSKDSNNYSRAIRRFLRAMARAGRHKRERGKLRSICDIVIFVRLALCVYMHIRETEYNVRLLFFQIARLLPVWLWILQRHFWYLEFAKYIFVLSRMDYWRKST